MNTFTGIALAYKKYCSAHEQYLRETFIKLMFIIENVVTNIAHNIAHEKYLLTSEQIFYQAVNELQTHLCVQLSTINTYYRYTLAVQMHLKYLLTK